MFVGSSLYRHCIMNKWHDVTDALSGNSDVDDTDDDDEMFF